MMEDSDSGRVNLLVHPSRQPPPVYQIPSEITLCIFGYCIPEDEFPSVRSAPFQLTHVCRTWRELAIATPRLWCKILLRIIGYLSHEPPTTTFVQKLCDKNTLELWMERAGNLLMSVDIQYSTSFDCRCSGCDSKPEFGLPPSIRVITANPTRWKYIKLSMPARWLGMASDLIQLDALPNLETFDIDDTTIPTVGQLDSNLQDPFFLESTIAETLTTLVARAPIDYMCPEPSPFVRLCTLSLQHSFPDECLHLLNHCPVLEDLTLHFCELPEDFKITYTDIDDDDDEQPVTILLPRLRNFHLAHTRNGEDGSRGITPGYEIGKLLDFLEVPNLQCFYLWMTTIGFFIYYGCDGSWDYLPHLITRSNCSLTELELRTPFVNLSSILKCLQLSPDLKYVGIPAEDICEDVIRMESPGLEGLRLFEHKQCFVPNPEFFRASYSGGARNTVDIQ